MSEFYDYESTSARCLRSSPIASVIGLVIVLVGAAAFGGGVIYVRKNLISFIEADHILPYVEYAVYAVLGATGLFALIAYIICSVSSGWNAKRCFESSKKSACGRCLATTLLVCLVIAIIFWVLMAALLSYPVTSMALLLFRDAGPVRVLTSSHTFPVGTVTQPTMAANTVRLARDAEKDAETLNTLLGVPSGIPSEALEEAASLNESPSADVPIPVSSTRDWSPIPNPQQAISEYFKCSESTVDLAYYGLYDERGYPLIIKSANLDIRIRDTLIFACVAFMGCLFVLFGYMLIMLCIAMNCARLKEMRYYDPSETGDETIRLRP